MTDLIIKKHVDTLEESLAKAKARGAWIIDDSRDGTGFSEDADEGVGCVSGYAGTPDKQLSYDDPEILDLEKRVQDRPIVAQIDEETKRLNEENTGAVRKFRFNHQQDFMDWVPGRILHLNEFLSLLQQIRPDAFVAEHQVMGLRGLGFVQGGTPTYSGTSVQDVAPEWSQMRVDIHQTPINERYRGWRTVLLACIKGEFLTVEQCDAVFGKPSGYRSRPWYRELYRIRNGRCGECRRDHCICADRYDLLRADSYQYAIPEDVKQGKQQRMYESRIFVP